MIIQIRGTSGSGKSTVMRAIMDALGPWEGVRMDGRKQPLFYSNTDDWIILGHYESPCGGCDTIGSARQVYETWSQLDGGTFHGGERHFLMEGLLLSEDTKWSSQLPDLRVYYLTTSPERCLEQIKQRRESVGNMKELKPDNTLNRVAVIDRSRVKLKELGVPVFRCSARQCIDLILEAIRLHANKETE